MELDTVLRFAHVLGACVLIGTGSGIAFFMLMAHITKDAPAIAHTARVVVIADYIFTATAAIAQPITGGLLMWHRGWPISEGWLTLSLALYVLIGAFWIPVVFIQKQMRDEARQAAITQSMLSARYFKLFRIWFVCGIPAFIAILALLWLMLEKPSIALL
jgi:uncharacterized membrane protein